MPGRWATVRTWLSALPAAQVAADPTLSVARAWADLDSGRLDEVAAALDAARAHGTANPHLLVLHALCAFKMGDLERAWGWLADARVSGDDPFVSTVHSLVGGVVMLWSGRLPQADILLLRAARRAADDGNGLAHLYAVGVRALAALVLGDHREARELTAQAEAEVIATMSQEHFVAMLPALARARLALAAADEVSGRPALEHARTAIALARRGASRVELAAALLTAAATRSPGVARDGARVGAVRATTDEVESWIHQARSLLEASQDPGPVVTSWLTAQRRRGGADVAWPDSLDPLTERELDILRQLPGALSQRDSLTLSSSPPTRSRHICGPSTGSWACSRAATRC